MHYDFIEIGTADFDTLVEQDWPEDVTGICVEPRKHLLDNLVCRPNVKKVNAGISLQDGDAPIYYLDDENLPLSLTSAAGFSALNEEEIRGCSSLYHLHPFINHFLETSFIAPEHVQTNIVPVMTWATFADKYDVTTIGDLKIDAEGHDVVILEQYLAYCETHPECLAQRVQFEKNSETWGDIFADLIKKLNAIGYVEDCLSNLENAFFVLSPRDILIFGQTNLVINK